MSVSDQITRLQTDRNTIRAKLVELGIATTTDNLDKLAAAIDGIENRGAVSATVQEGDTYTIPKGYHNGSGTVSGVAGGGNYNLQSKTVTPTKNQQNVTPDSGYYGLSDVTVGAIPESYHDVSSVDAAAENVLANKKFVDSTGKLVAGTMPNNGAVEQTLDAETASYTIPKGFHNGSGVVNVVLETKSAPPTKLARDIVPTSGKLLSKVTIEPIPDAYQDITRVTIYPEAVLSGGRFVDSDGVTQYGTMPNKGNIKATINGLDVTSYTIPKGYHEGEGTVSLTTDIEEALAAI